MSTRQRVQTSLFLVAVLGVSALCGAALADVVGLEIIGPNEVAENFSASYKAIAFYDDNSTRDVTDSALLVVEPNMAASIDENGVLRTKDIVTHQSATILASYTEGDVTFDADKVVNIFPTCPGTALQFDGVDDYVEVLDDDTLDGMSELTITMWVKPDSLANYRCLIHKGNWGQGFVAHVGVGLYEGIFWGFDAVFGGRAHSAKNLTIGQWQFMTFWFKGDYEWRIYINGLLEGNASSVVSAIPVSPHNIGIGERFDTGHSKYKYFDGLMDDVRIYNRALSDEEIQANMHMRLAGDEPNLVAYWDFDEGGGQIVYDLSGNGNNGYLGGDPCAVEESAPAWVESDAPVGICSLYQIATLATDGAVERKTALLEELLAGLTQEWTAYQAIEEWLESGDYGDLYKGDIVTAKQKIHSATQHEEQSIDALEKSVEKLKDALSALGYEPEPPASNQRILSLSGLEWTEPVPLMEVNSELAKELTPFLSFDGLTLYFTRVRSDTFYYGRIFEATREQPYGPFTSVKEIDGTLNSSPGHVISPWVSPDNLRMYYYTESSARWELKVTERASDNSPWPIGTNISELNMLSKLHQTPRLTADELTIVFSSYNM